MGTSDPSDPDSALPENPAHTESEAVRSAGTAPLVGPVECPACGDWNPCRHVERHQACLCCGADLDRALEDE